MNKATGEQERLDALRSYNILDTLPEPGFDALVCEAAQQFDTPIALISLVDEERQWFKAAIGLDVSETPRSISFCAHAIRSEDIFLVADALADPVFSNNPLVQKDPGIRFYAGAPIETKEGHKLGTICVIDRSPRNMLPSDTKQTLKGLADKVMALIESRSRICTK
ncbi:GAF domain-containing protein [Novosphingobium beihaiensis]|uniref:GAF domain-containing protein n=1 Tax=Novosphingobium beihaiensis TaxID=2930389 RepID=A0ABT0BUX6_9SPHN|nr:GAF domain-containing protein [Novosphingobium beihaiensis]MCJ2188871.1 GAF domain-containing protein [Novosphingobium beihaiensis]